MLGLLQIIGNGPQNIRRSSSFNKSRSHKLDVYVYIGRLEAVVLPYILLDSVRYYSLESSPRILTNARLLHQSLPNKSSDARRVLIWLVTSKSKPGTVPITWKIKKQSPASGGIRLFITIMVTVRLPCPALKFIFVFFFVVGLWCPLDSHWYWFWIAWIYVLQGQQVLTRITNSFRTLVLFVGSSLRRISRKRNVACFCEYCGERGTWRHVGSLIHVAIISVELASLVAGTSQSSRLKVR